MAKTTASRRAGRPLYVDETVRMMIGRSAADGLGAMSRTMLFKVLDTCRTCMTASTRLVESSSSAVSWRGIAAFGFACRSFACRSFGGGA